MIYGLAAAAFLGMMIIFIGIAVETGAAWAWGFVVSNAAFTVTSLMRYFAKEEKRRG